MDNFYNLGDYTGREGALYTSCTSEQSPSVCEWHSVGTTLQLSHLYRR